METTIKISLDVKKILDKLKVHHRETYNELIFRIVNSLNEEKDNLIETLEVLSNPETMRNIAQAMEDINDKRKWISWEKVKRENEL